MIDKTVKRVNMYKSLFGIGYCEHLYKGKEVSLEREIWEIQGPSSGIGFGKGK